MRRRLTAATALLLAGCPAPSAPRVAEPVGAYTPGQLLVKFTAPPSDEAVRGAIAGMGATAIAPLGHGLWQVGVPAGQERDWMDRFQRRGDVAYAEVDRHFQNEMVGGFRMVGARTVQAAAPNDPLYPANPVNPVTHQPRLGLPGQWGLDAMQVLNAWDTTTGSGVLVAGRIYWFLLPFVILYLLLYIPVMKREEQELHQGYGDSFLAYAGRVPMFFPRLSPAEGEPSAFLWSRVKRNREHRHLLALLIAGIFLIAKSIYWP